MENTCKVCGESEDREIVLVPLSDPEGPKLPVCTACESLMRLAGFESLLDLEINMAKTKAFSSL